MSSTTTVTILMPQAELDELTVDHEAPLACALCRVRIAPAPAGAEAAGTSPSVPCGSPPDGRPEQGRAAFPAQHADEPSCKVEVHHVRPRLAALKAKGGQISAATCAIGRPARARSTRVRLPCTVRRALRWDVKTSVCGVEPRILHHT